MKFSIIRSNVVDALSKIQGICSRRTNTVIGNCVLIRAEPGRIWIYANDGETGFEGFYPAEVESEGKIALNARKLFEIIKDFPTDEILFKEVDNYWIEIGSERVQFNMVGMNPDDFLDIPFMESDFSFRMESAPLKKMIERSQVVSVGDERKPHTLGICLQCLSDENQTILRMLSTDSNRLSKTEYVFPEKIDIENIHGILIPKKGVNEVARILRPDDPIDIAVENNHIFFRQNNETTVIRLLEGSFPQYGDIISWPDAHLIRVNTKMFIGILKRMSILSSDDYKAVIFNLFEGKMTISSTNPELGESREELSIDYQGEPLEIGLNPRFVIEALSLIEDEFSIIRITNGKAPCLIEGELDKSYLNVTMPMRL